MSLVVLGAVLFVVNAGVSRVLLRAGLTPAELTSLRVTGTVVCLGLVMALVRPGTLRPPRGRTLLLMVALGLSGVALVQWAYFVALDRLAVGMALLLEYTAPILVALWARFVQKEQVRPRLWYALALSIVGLAMIAQIWHGFTLDPIGVAAGFLAAIAFAAYYLLSEHGVSRLDPLTVFFWSFAVAAVALNLVSPVTSLDWAAAGTSVSLLGSARRVLGSGMGAPPVGGRPRHPDAVRVHHLRPQPSPGDDGDHGRLPRAGRGHRPRLGLVRRVARRGAVRGRRPGAHRDPARRFGPFRPPHLRADTGRHLGV